MEKKEVKSVFCYPSQSCVYNEIVDANPVEPDLGVSIDDMLKTGIVKDSGETLDNNGIDEPSRIIGRVRDVFDALDASRVIKKYGKKPSKAAEAVKDAVSTSDNSPS